MNSSGRHVNDFPSSWAFRSHNDAYLSDLLESCDDRAWVPLYTSRAQQAGSRRNAGGKRRHNSRWDQGDRDQ